MRGKKIKFFDGVGDDLLILHNILISVLFIFSFLFFLSKKKTTTEKKQKKNRNKK